MTVGSIVLATDQGLGYLARSFFKQGIIQKVLIHPHSSRPNHPEWYPPEARMVHEDELLASCDALIFFEELWDHWKIIPKARALGKKTALMPMYECTRNPLPYQPDVILAPSKLDERYYPTSVFVPVPVAVPWQKRTRAYTYVHNAGNGGLGGRNGTRELFEAMKYVTKPLKLIVRSQTALVNVPIDPRITYHFGQTRADKLWDEGDVFVFPEKFNGLSLPLQEAYASGMLVMTGDRFPMNTWLPKEPLIPVARYIKEYIATEFDSAMFDPKQIAATMDAWYGKNISAFSVRGREWARKHSWENLKKTYEILLSPSSGGPAS